ncbi:hypothetical protein B5S33_g483 [[Candida] boidinii]|nr:hypothetical protein B5S33_g483 [[Candida] boidinii]
MSSEYQYYVPNKWRVIHDQRSHIKYNPDLSNDSSVTKNYLFAIQHNISDDLDRSYLQVYVTDLQNIWVGNYHCFNKIKELSVLNGTDVRNKGKLRQFFQLLDDIIDNDKKANIEFEEGNGISDNSKIKFCMNTDSKEGDDDDDEDGEEEEEIGDQSQDENCESNLQIIVPVFKITDIETYAKIDMQMKTQLYRSNHMMSMQFKESEKLVDYKDQIISRLLDDLIQREGSIFGYGNSMDTDYSNSSFDSATSIDRMINSESVKKKIPNYLTSFLKPYKPGSLLDGHSFAETSTWKIIEELYTKDNDYNIIKDLHTKKIESAKDDDKKGAEQNSKSKTSLSLIDQLASSSDSHSETKLKTEAQSDAILSDLAKKPKRKFGIISKHSKSQKSRPLTHQATQLKMEGQTNASNDSKDTIVKKEIESQIIPIIKNESESQKIPSSSDVVPTSTILETNDANSEPPLNMGPKDIQGGEKKVKRKFGVLTGRKKKQKQ